MKVTITCMRCELINAEASESPSLNRGLMGGVFQVPYQESIFYDVICPNGHRNRLIHDSPKHEMLFEAGIQALRDGYYREAVSSFAVSLERFYEYAIRVMCTPIQENFGKESFAETWKSISKQSERQIGAFYALYLTSFNRSPLVFDTSFLKLHKLKLSTNNDPINFRNRVVHQGYIPSYEQALFFGEAVNFYIRTHLKEFYKFENERFRIYAPMMEDMEAAESSFEPLEEKQHQGQAGNFLSLGRISDIMDMISLVEFTKSGRRGYNL